MRPASSYQSPSMTPPERAETGDEECEVQGCPYLQVYEHDMCEEHMRELGDEIRAERQIEQRWAEAYGNNTGEQYE